VYILYALLLLYLHQKHFIRLRHRYLSAHSSQNMWRVVQNEDTQQGLHLTNTLHDYSKLIRSWFSTALSTT